MGLTSSAAIARLPGIRFVLDYQAVPPARVGSRPQAAEVNLGRWPWDQVDDVDIQLRDDGAAQPPEALLHVREATEPLVAPGAAPVDRADRDRRQASGSITEESCSDARPQLPIEGATPERHKLPLQIEHGTARAFGDLGHGFAGEET